MVDEVSSPRAQLVELLWQLKQNFDQENDSSLRFVHFNTLLNDPAYRAEVIQRAVNSENKKIRNLGLKLQDANRDGMLLHKRPSAPGSSLPITNPDSLAAYREKAGAALAKHGVRVVTSSPQQRVIEGSRDETGVGVILEFDSTEAALGWINDEELKEVHGLRQAAGNGAITLLG